MSLSLIQQCNCLRYYTDPEDPTKTVVEQLIMRPIASGATDGSTLEHSINWWKDKNGVTKSGVAFSD